MAARRKAKAKKLGAIDGWRVLYEDEDMLPVPLTPAGMDARLSELRQLKADIEADERVAAEIKQRLKAPRRKQQELMEQVVSGKYEDGVECTTYIDPEDKVVRVVRHDTGEVIEEREAHEWESQRSLADDEAFEAEPEAEQDGEEDPD